MTDDAGCGSTEQGSSHLATVTVTQKPDPEVLQEMQAGKVGEGEPRRGRQALDLRGPDMPSVELWQRDPSG